MAEQSEDDVKKALGIEASAANHPAGGAAFILRFPPAMLVEAMEPTA